MLKKLILWADKHRRSLLGGLAGFLWMLTFAIHPVFFLTLGILGFIIGFILVLVFWEEVVDWAEGESEDTY